MTKATRAPLAGVALLAMLGMACMRAGAPPASSSASSASVVDSATIALWRMDERAGVTVADSGPFRLDGVAGPATRTDFGRFDGAREFSRTLDSFVFVPYHEALQTAAGFTVEAWVFAKDFGHYEDTPLAARWTEEANHQSWLFGLVGRRLKPPAARLASPGFHDAFVVNGAAGLLLFVYQPDVASPPRAFVSTRRIELSRWTHVAASLDGEVVQLYINGKLDAQYATRGRIRHSPAPLLIGNYFDVRYLSSFGGDLRLQPGGDPNPYYAFEGFLDELRISSIARTDFPAVDAP